MAGARRALILATDDYTDAGLADLSAPELDAQQLREVLEDPRIGGFEVTTLLNERESDVRRTLARFLKARPTEDLLVHVSCHGVKAPDGTLYLATTDTELALLSATALPAEFVNSAMEESRANSILLMLDCCYAGAFAKGMKAKAGGPVDVDERLGGSGRAVITATDALQFAFEGSDLVQGDPAARPSIFTDVVVQGLRTGQADLDQDGRVTLRELFEYVDDEVRRRQPDQTPRLFIHDVSGDLFVAGRTTPATKPTPLPPKVQAAVESEDYWTRVGIVSTLLEHVRGEHPGRALAARQALGKLAADPDDRVKAEAREGLASVPDPVASEDRERPERERLEREDQEGLEREERGRLEHERQERISPPPLPWWRRTAVQAVGGAAAVALAAGLWVAVSPDDDPRPPDPGPSPTDTTTVPADERVPDSVLLLTRRDQGVVQLVSVDLAAGNAVEGVEGNESFTRPTISPDRAWVAALRQVGDTFRQSVPYLGGGDLEATPLLDGEVSRRCPYTTRPAWNSASTQLAVVCLARDGSARDLLVVGRDGRLVRELFAGGGLTESPTWGDDGRVYFVREADDGTTSAWSVPETGGEAVPLSDMPTGSVVSHLDWSPSGLLYLRGSVGTVEADVFIRPWEKDPEHVQVSWNGEAGSPTWSPDGRGVAWLSNGLLVVRETLESSEMTVDVGAEPGPPAWGSR